MSVEAWDIIFHGAATMPDDDTTTQIGGAIDRTIKLSFAKLTLGTAQVIKVKSESASDTTQTITVYGRNAAGEKINSGSELALNGTTEVSSTTTFERIMKALKSATCVGNVGIYANTATATGTAQEGGANRIRLAAGASAVDNAYQFMVVIITAGTGSGQIREAARYDGTTKDLYVRDWDTNPDGTSQYAIYEGVVMEKETGFEIDEVRRVFYDAAANPAGGAQKTYYEKGFVWNDHASLALTNAKIAEVSEGGYAKVTFALETTLDGTGDNGAGNSRLVAPSAGVGSFSDAQKDVANSGSLSPGAGQGVWIALTLDGGDAAQNTFYKLQVTGQST